LSPPWRLQFPRYPLHSLSDGGTAAVADVADVAVRVPDGGTIVVADVAGVVVHDVRDGATIVGGAREDSGQKGRYMDIPSLSASGMLPARSYRQ